MFFIKAESKISIPKYWVSIVFEWWVFETIKLSHLKFALLNHGQATGHADILMDIAKRHNVE